MSEMVKRVASAIQAADGMPMSIALCHARAAIASMREPTADMVAQGEKAGYFGGHGEPNVIDANDAWVRMIDAALKE